MEGVVEWRAPLRPGISLNELGQAYEGYLVGTSLTPADLAVWDALDAVLTWIEGAEIGTFGRIERFYESIKARPALAEYLGSDRRIGR